MTEKIDQRLHQLRHQERELRDQATLAQSSMDNMAHLDNMLSAISSEIAQLESHRARSW